MSLSDDRSLTTNVFVRPFLGQYYHDPLQNIQHQATVAVGAGHYIYDRPHLQWQIFGGPAYQYTKFDTTEAGQSREDSRAAIVLQSSYDKKLTSRLDLMLQYQGILTSKDAGLYIQHAIGSLEFKLTHTLDLDLSLICDRTAQPQANSSGHVPKRDDFQVVLSLGVQF